MATLLTTNPPTTVTLRDGTSYIIPGGEPFTWAWARQASLIAVAYRQVGDTANAEIWDREYNRRATAYSMIEAGRDKAEVIAQFWKDLLVAPLRIAADIGNAVIDTAGRAADTVFDWAKALPVILLVALVVVGVGFYRGSLRVSR